MAQLRLDVEYDGTDLCGYQRQANGPTVQGHLEEVLSRMFDAPIVVTGASRTDAGVHARGQVVTLRPPRALPLEGLRRGLNSMLPETIAVRAVTEVGDDFHPRLSATGKHYRYQLWLRPSRAPRLRAWAWHRFTPLDRPAMAAAAAGLVGEHDFAAFRAVGCTALTTRRLIRSIDLVELEPDLLAIEVRGNAFLRNMVRILAGTLVDVGEGRLEPGQMPEILASGDRARAGQTAPAHGLCLMEVCYDGVRVGPPPRLPAL
ncbi:MAG: tRNA pseudouridine(38-40) synthase TruA [Kofleriaceae bacterium]